MHNDIHNNGSEKQPNQLNDKFSDLKNLLFQEDLLALEEKISKNKSNLESTHSESYKEELFNQFLLKTLKEKIEAEPEVVAKILSEVLPQAIGDIKTRELKNELTEKISPFVGKALKTQIQKEKDTIIDILYPIIGTLISKYIKNAFAELNEAINAQVESALPINVIRRRIKSKMTGLSESEILFQESIQSHIKSFYLIHKETGVVVASSHDHNDDAENSQDSMIGGMFSAITHFVNDWIENGKEEAELSSIDYGDSTISFMSSGSLMSAIVVKGELSPKLKASIRKLLIQLSSEHQSFISSFNGDTSSVPKNIEHSLSKTLKLSNIKIKEKPGLNKKAILVGFVLAGAIIAFYNYYS